MYPVILAIHFLGIGIIFAELLYLLSQRPSRLQTVLIILLVALLVNFAGAFIEITASSEEQAMLGIRFSYIGKPFIIYSMFLFITYFARMRLPSIVPLLFGIETLVVVILAFSCPYHDLFYTTREFVQAGVFPHMVLGKGIAYIIHSVVLLAFFGYFVWCCIHQIRRAKTKSERAQAYSLFAMLAICVVSYFVFFSGIAGGYDTTLLGYVIAMIILMQTIFRHNLFETLTLASEQAILDYRDGLIVVDTHGELVLINKVASQVALTMSPKIKPLVDFANAYEGFKKDPNEKPITGLAYLLEEPSYQSERENTKATIEAFEAIINELHALSVSREPLFAVDEVFWINERRVEKEGTNYGTVYELLVITDSYHYAERLESDVEKKTREIRAIQRKATISFANMVEARDGTTGTHIVNTSKYVEMIAKELATSMAMNPSHYDDEFQMLLDPWYLETIVDAAPLHDLGKIYVPDAVLTKPGKLTAEEFEIIKKHPQDGADLIEKTLRGIESDEYVEVAKQIAIGHHERWDGNGYPQGTIGAETPLSARIMAVADVYDALRQERQYKKAFSKEKALDIIIDESGTHFDPQVVNAFLVAIEQED